MNTRTRPTELTILAQLRSTRDADTDARFRALLYPTVQRQAPDLLPMIFGQVRA